MSADDAVRGLNQLAKEAGLDRAAANTGSPGGQPLPGGATAKPMDSKMADLLREEQRAMNAMSANDRAYAAGEVDDATFKTNTREAGNAFSAANAKIQEAGGRPGTKLVFDRPKDDGEDADRAASARLKELGFDASVYRDAFVRHAADAGKPAQQQAAPLPGRRRALGCGGSGGGGYGQTDGSGGKAHQRSGQRPGGGDAAIRACRGRKGEGGSVRWTVERRRRDGQRARFPGAGVEERLRPKKGRDGEDGVSAQGKASCGRFDRRCGHRRSGRRNQSTAPGAVRAGRGPTGPKREGPLRVGRPFSVCALARTLTDFDNPKLEFCNSYELSE
ncbi:hypothetical protein ACIU1J_22680 [Azospirillum doebereinerae]|uniref:hypothetical protein n=1 Tax=Azospirillum doebereinerae TaxID=92933 RepID=UPI003850BC8B